MHVLPLLCIDGSSPPWIRSPSLLGDTTAIATAFVLTSRPTNTRISNCSWSCWKGFFRATACTYQGRHLLCHVGLPPPVLTFLQADDAANVADAVSASRVAAVPRLRRQCSGQVTVAPSLLDWGSARPFVPESAHHDTHLPSTQHCGRALCFPLLQANNHYKRTREGRTRPSML